MNDTPTLRQEYYPFQTPDDRPNKFEVGDRVTHRKDLTLIYEVIKAPTEVDRIEATGHPYYLYSLATGGVRWIRPKEEMEDGRFILYDRPAQKPLENPWKEELINEAMITFSYCAAHENNPKKCLQDIIEWHVMVALDPKVSSDAQKLKDHYLLELNCAKSTVIEQKAMIAAQRQTIADLTNRLTDDNK